MKKLLFGTLLLLFILIGCKSDLPLTQSLKFELCDDLLRGNVEIAGHHFVIDDSLELSIVKSRLDVYGVAHEIIPADSKYKYELKLPETADLDAIKSLLTTKGEFGFWETYRLEEISDMILIDSLRPYVQHVSYYNSNYVDIAIVDTARISAMLHRIAEHVPVSLKTMWAFNPSYNDSTSVSLHFLRGSGLGKGAAMDGHYIVDAKTHLSKWAPVCEVNMAMNTVGAQKWADLTKRNIGRCLAIVIDNKVYSAPMVQNSIEGGQSSITGNFTENEAKEMAAVLQSGPMVCKIIFLDEAKSSQGK